MQICSIPPATQFIFLVMAACRLISANEVTLQEFGTKMSEESTKNSGRSIGVTPTLYSNRLSTSNLSAVPGVTIVNSSNKNNVVVPPIQTTLASIGMPFNPQLLNTLGQQLVSGQSIDDIKLELSKMLFGDVATVGRPREASSVTSLPAVTVRPERLQLNNSSVVEGDRGPEYQDYDYKEFDSYEHYTDKLDDESRENISSLKGAKLNSTAMEMSEASLVYHSYGPLPQRRQRPSGNLIGPYLPIAAQGRILSVKNRPYIPLVTDAQLLGAAAVKQFQHEGSRRVDNENMADEAKESSATHGNDCDFYTDSLCLSVTNYPGIEILGLLSKNKRIGQDLVADVIDQNADKLIDGVTSAQESTYTFAHYYGGNRRQDENPSHRDFAHDGGFLCPSEIMYAKPKRGKSAQGVWKDIVNVKDYTQTLRMEKCLKPGGSCSYVSHHYKSQCSQVYNYHRLLSWNKERGLHMDIFKVPTCCSCHIMGYSYVYPPLKTSSNDVLSHSQAVQQPQDNYMPSSTSSAAVAAAAVAAAAGVNSNGFRMEGQPMGGGEIATVDDPENDFQSFVQTMNKQLPSSNKFGFQEAAQPSNGHLHTVPAPQSSNQAPNPVIKNALIRNNNNATVENDLTNPVLTDGKINIVSNAKFNQNQGNSNLDPNQVVNSNGNFNNRRQPRPPLLNLIRNQLSGLIRPTRPRTPPRNVPRRRMDSGEDVPHASEVATQMSPKTLFTAITTTSQPLKQEPFPEKQQPSDLGKTLEVYDLDTILEKEPEKAAVKDSLSLEKAGVENSDNVHTKTVNYAYHPIIDFFDRYRWSAAA